MVWRFKYKLDFLAQRQMLKVWNTSEMSRVVWSVVVCVRAPANQNTRTDIM